MSIYTVNLVGRRVLHDPEFRERMRVDPVAALAGLDLDADERESLLAGDVGRLYQLGAHEFMLMMLARFEVLGLDRETYADRMRALAPTTPASAPD